MTETRRKLAREAVKFWQQHSVRYVVELLAESLDEIDLLEQRVRDASRRQGELFPGGAR